MKIKMVCSECGSEDVLADAWAEWDIDTQEWVLQTTFDEKFCPDCDCSCKVDEVEICLAQMD